MSELETRIKTLPTFKTLSEVDAEIKAAKTPKNFDSRNLNHVLAQAERLRNSAGLDRQAAVAAFRLEVLSTDDSTLSLVERLAVLAAYDPEVTQRKMNNSQQINQRMNAGHFGGGHRRFVARSMRARQSLVGLEGDNYLPPLHTAGQLVESIDTARTFAEQHAGSRIGIRLSDKNALIGTLPSADISFGLAQPELDAEGGIDYTVPSAFRSVSDLEYFTPGEKQKLTKGDKGLYPSLLSVEKGKLVANPQLNKIRQELGLMGVNIYRSFYLFDFDEAIKAESEGLYNVIPDAPVRRRRNRGMHGLYDEEFPVRMK